MRLLAKINFKSNLSVRVQWVPFFSIQAAYIKSMGWPQHRHCVSTANWNGYWAWIRYCLSALLMSIFKYILKLCFNRYWIILWFSEFSKHLFKNKNMAVPRLQLMRTFITFSEMFYFNVTFIYLSIFLTYKKQPAGSVYKKRMKQTYRSAICSSWSLIIKVRMCLVDVK